MESASPELRLSQCMFKDMYVSTDPMVAPLMRGLRLPGQEMSAQALSRPPREMFRDVTKLIDVLRETYERLMTAEFTIVYDGVHYRCARISPPRRGGTVLGAGTDQAEWCLRRLASRPIPFAELGLPASISPIISGYANLRGLLLVSGPFGSGKTMSAGSILDHWVEATGEVAVTLEDPPEVPLARKSDKKGTIYQMSVTGGSMPDAIRAMRRWAPRYVYLGEIRTGEEAAELLHVAISGPLVICTIHADNSVSAIRSVIRFAQNAMGESDARDILAASLLGVTFQEMDRMSRPRTQLLDVSGAESQVIRTRIRLGDFHSVREDQERQDVLRSRGSMKMIG